MLEGIYNTGNFRFKFYTLLTLVPLVKARDILVVDTMYNIGTI